VVQHALGFVSVAEFPMGKQNGDWGGQAHLRVDSKSKVYQLFSETAIVTRRMNLIFERVL
jgi:hypothetical protein